MVQSREASRVEIIPHHPRASSSFHCWECESTAGTESRPWSEFSASTCSDYPPLVIDLLALLGSSLDGNTIGNVPREVTITYEGNRAEYLGLLMELEPNHRSLGLDAMTPHATSVLGNFISRLVWPRPWNPLPRRFRLHVTTSRVCHQKPGGTGHRWNRRNFEVL